MVSSHTELFVKIKYLDPKMIFDQISLWHSTCCYICCYWAFDGVGTKKQKNIAPLKNLSKWNQINMLWEPGLSVKIWGWPDPLKCPLLLWQTNLDFLVFCSTCGWWKYHKLLCRWWQSPTPRGWRWWWDPNSAPLLVLWWHPQRWTLLYLLVQRLQKQCSNDQSVIISSARLNSLE